MAALQYPCPNLSETWWCASCQSSLCLSSLQRESSLTLCNETCAGEYRRTNHGHACPTGDHFVKSWAWTTFIWSVANLSVLLTCQLPHQHHPDQAQTQQSVQLGWSSYAEVGRKQNAMWMRKKLNCVAQTRKSRHRACKHPSMWMCSVHPQERRMASVFLSALVFHTTIVQGPPYLTTVSSSCRLLSKEAYMLLIKY